MRSCVVLRRALYHPGRPRHNRGGRSGEEVGVGELVLRENRDGWMLLTLNRPNKLKALIAAFTGKGR